MDILGRFIEKAVENYRALCLCKCNANIPNTIRSDPLGATIIIHLKNNNNFNTIKPMDKQSRRLFKPIEFDGELAPSSWPFPTGDKK